MTHIQQTSSSVIKMMEVFNERHKTIGENIGNSSVPHAKSKDIFVPNDEAELVQLYKHNGHLHLHTTSSKHISNKARVNKFQTFNNTTGIDEKQNGNNILPTYEAMRMSENKTRYEIASKAYQSINNLYMIALDK